MFEEVAAFEPIESFRRCFVRNVTAENVTLYPFALGSAKMEIASANSGVSHIGELGQHAALEYLQQLGAEVRARMVDDWIVAWPE